MKYPQTDIINIEKKISNIKKYGCCAFCTLWALGYDAISNDEAIKLLIRGIETGALEEDCTVNWKQFAKLITNENYDVEMLDLINQTKDELKNYQGRIIVRFDNGNNYHWVGYENGKLAFNSLNYSYCVEYGRPTKIRILKKI